MKTLLLLLALLPVACASHSSPLVRVADEKPEIFADQVNRDQLVGLWFGESPVKDGSSMKWLIERRKDGTYISRFKITNAQGTREQTETGFWGIAGGVYFTLTRGFVEKGRVLPVDFTNATYADTYKALRVAPSEFAYRSLSTQEEFTVKRVGRDFRL